MNVDGRSTNWHFIFRERGSGDLLFINVYENVARLQREPNALNRTAEDAIEPLDSQRTVHVAIARLEQRVGTFRLSDAI